jgi:hypothetical protein
MLNAPAGSSVEGRQFLSEKRAGRGQIPVLCGCIGTPPDCKFALMFCRGGRVQPYFRPVDAVVSNTAGPDAIREFDPHSALRALMP